jgi:glycosyltransferase involved in cell wall biosynthesis
LVDWKAVDLLIEAFSKLTPKCASTLEIIGDGPCRSALEAQAATLGLTDQVTFHGALPQPAIARRLQAVDVFVLPSLFEAGGAVVLEAMSVGLPTIATAWGGPTDYVTPQCGILVEPNGRATFVDGLIRAMTRLAADRRLRQQMGAMGRRRVVDAFDWECKIDAILRIYKQTIDEAQRRRANNAK